MKKNSSKANIAKKYLQGTLGVVAGTFSMGISPLLAIPIALYSGVKLKQAMMGEYIDNSFINVNSSVLNGNKHEVVQSFPPNLRQLIGLIGTKDKKQFLLMQELNFLLGSDTLDKNGDKIKYSTVSQNLTYAMLKKMQQAGFIENLTCNEKYEIDKKTKLPKIDEKTGKPISKKRALVAEKLLLGNSGDLFKNGKLRKNRMFDIAFEKADKKIVEADIINFLGLEKDENESIDNTKYVIKKDKDGNILNIGYKISSIVNNALFPIKSLSKAKETKLLEASKEPEISKMQLELNSMVNDKTTVTNFDKTKNDSEKIKDDNIITPDENML